MKDPRITEMAAPFAAYTVLFYEAGELTWTGSAETLLADNWPGSGDIDNEGIVHDLTHALGKAAEAPSAPVRVWNDIEIKLEPNDTEAAIVADEDLEFRGEAIRPRPVADRDGVIEAFESALERTPRAFVRVHRSALVMALSLLRGALDHQVNCEECLDGGRQPAEEE